MPKLFRLSQVRQGHGLEHVDASVQRMLEIPYPRVGHQRLAATAEELIEQWQVGPVVEHIGDQDQVEAISLGEEVRRITQLHAIECGIGLARGNRQRVEVAGHHFQRPGLDRRDARHAGTGTKIQYALALDPLRLFGQVAGHRQAAGPTEAPIGRLVENAAGFFRAEGTVHVVAVDQPQLQVSAG